MSIGCQDGMLPLRTTCNRCRELKVRCQRNLTNHGLQDHQGLAPCVRCSRAGAVCTYSPQQRSGRPPVVKAHNGHGVGQPHKRQRSRVASVMSPSAPRLSMYSGDVPSTPMSPERTTFWPDSWFVLDSEHGTTGDPESDMEALPSLSSEDPTMVPLAHVDASFITSAREANPTGSLDGMNSLVEADDKLSDIKELSDVMIRIHRAVGVPPAQLLRDELIDITRRLVMVLGRSTDRVKQQVQPDIHDNLASPLVPPVPISSAGSCYSSVEAPNCSGDPSMNHKDGLDNAVILMVHACYQQLFHLFKQTCLFLRSQQSTFAETVDPSTSRDTSGQLRRDYGVLPEAQIAMTTELISHLMSRLDRGLYQLSASLSADGPGALPASSSTLSSSPNQQPMTPESSASAPVASNQPSTEFESARLIIEAMMRSRASLYTHISLIKRSLRESDGI